MCMNVHVYDQVHQGDCNIPEKKNVSECLDRKVMVMSLNSQLAEVGSVLRWLQDAATTSNGGVNHGDQL